MNAGQAVRLPSIPADAGKGYGVFEELHGFDTAKALALHLEDAAKTCYGQPFRTFVSELTGRLKNNPEDVKARIKVLQAEFEALWRQTNRKERQNDRPQRQKRKR